MNLGNVHFEGWDCIAQLHYYANGRAAIKLIDRNNADPIAIATVNIPEVQLQRGHVLVKQTGIYASIPAELQRAGIIGEAVREYDAGMVAGYAAECPLLVGGGVVSWHGVEFQKRFEETDREAADRLDHEAGGKGEA